MTTTSKSTARTEAPRREFKYLTIISGLVSGILVLSTISSSKLFSIGPLNLPGGVLLFPVLFIFNDILTEVYGYAASRKVVWTALFSQAFAGAALWLVDVLPPASFWPNQQAFHSVLGFVPRIAIGGTLSVFLGEMANSYIMSKMKYWAEGIGGWRGGWRQRWRFVASTIVGEGVDTIVVMTIAFAGVIPAWDLIKTALTLYIVKVLYEIVALPFSVPFSNWIKKKEGNYNRIDTPQDTNYNPFLVGD